MNQLWVDHNFYSCNCL